jgi:hypothetical protein
MRGCLQKVHPQNATLGGRLELIFDDAVIVNGDGAEPAKLRGQ